MMTEACLDKIFQLIVMKKPIQNAKYICNEN